MEMRLEIVEAFADTIWVLQGSSEWFAQRRADNNDVEAALVLERGNKYDTTTQTAAQQPADQKYGA